MGIPFPGRAGGPPTHLPYLVDFFEHHPGFTIRTFYYGGASDRPESTATRLLHTIRTWWRFVMLLLSFRPNIIHLNTAFDPKTILRDIPFSVTCLLLHQHLIFKFHGSLTSMIETRKPLWRVLNSLVFSGAQRIGVLSEPEREQFIHAYGHANKFITVRNIVHSGEHLDSGLPAYKREIQHVTGLFAARIIPEKGLSDVLRAMPSILSVHPHFVLVVAGDGPDLQPSKQLAITLEINHAVRWLGYIPNTALSLVFHETDFLIFASRLPEGMPMTILDAMRNNLPVITTPVRFALEHFRQGDHCLFFTPGNTAELAAAVSGMINDAAMRKTMVENNLKLITCFSAEKVGNHFAAIYKDMLQ
jgi:glycosyltransferase involved in cell wall biosynthesis